MMPFRRSWLALPLIVPLVSPSQAAVQLVRDWTASPVLLQSVAFSPDGRLLLTASGSGVGQLWTLDGSPGPELKGQRPPMFKAHFNADGSRLITTGYDGSLLIWTPQGEVLSRLALHSAAIADARYLPPTAFVDAGLVTSSDDGQVVIRASDGSPLWSRQFTGTARQLATNRDGSLIVASSDDGQLHFIRPDSKRNTAEVMSVQTTHGRINRIDFSPEQTRLAVAGIDGQVTVWTLSGEQLLSLPASYLGWSRGAVFCPLSGHPLLTIGDDGVVREWSAAGVQQDSLRLTHTARLTSIDCSPDGRFAVVVGSNGRLWLLSVTVEHP